MLHIAMHTLAAGERATGISLGTHEIHTGTTNSSLVHNLLSDKPSVSESVKIYKLYHNGALNASKRAANDAGDSGIPPPECSPKHNRNGPQTKKLEPKVIGYVFFGQSR